MLSALGFKKSRPHKSGDKKVTSEAAKKEWIDSIKGIKQATLAWLSSESGWKRVSDGEKTGIVIYSRDVADTIRREDRKAPKGYIEKQKKYKIWRCVAEVQAPIADVVRLLTDLPNTGVWNPVIQNATIIEQLDAQTDVTWCISKATVGGGKLTQPRDFVALRRCEALDAGKHLITGMGVIHPRKSELDSAVRGWNGPGGFLVQPTGSNRCQIIWVLNAHSRLPGWIPSPLYENAMIEVITEMVQSLRATAIKTK